MVLILILYNEWSKEFHKIGPFYYHGNAIISSQKHEGSSFMKVKKLKFTVRVEEDLLRKFGYVAEYNARSTNREVEFLMRKRIIEFEKIHGRITIE